MPPNPPNQRHLLRILACGSVDDGKSTLIGRLLFDSRAVLADQIAAIDHASKKRGAEKLDLSLFTDGLRWEREQGITIDVAYRHFRTAARRFILIDSPGHVQYTRNMVTGASHADAAIILVDARNGLREQTHRHAYVAALLGIRSLVVAVNKMDLVGWDRAVFDSIRAGFAKYSAELGSPDVAFVPVSALNGDNVVERSNAAPWYDGPTLLELLERAPTPDWSGGGPARFPVQCVIRPREGEHREFRGYAGEVVSGVFRVGDRVRAMSSGRESVIRAIRVLDKELTEARPPRSVVLTMADEIDIGRGEMLCKTDEAPEVSREFDATLVWMGPAALQVGRKYLLRHTTHFVPAVVASVESRFDISLFRDGQAAALEANDIGQVRVRTASPLYLDTYDRCRATGSFVLIDEATGDTVAAGLVRATGAVPH